MERFTLLAPAMARRVMLGSKTIHSGSDYFYLLIWSVLLDIEISPMTNN